MLHTRKGVSSDFQKAEKWFEETRPCQAFLKDLQRKMILENSVAEHFHIDYTYPFLLTCINSLIYLSFMIV